MRGQRSQSTSNAPIVSLIGRPPAFPALLREACGGDKNPLGLVEIRRAAFAACERKVPNCIGHPDNERRQYKKPRLRNVAEKTAHPHCQEQSSHRHVVFLFRAHLAPRLIADTVVFDGTRLR